jgi:hypothetical protein
VESGTVVELCYYVKKNKDYLLIGYQINPTPYCYECRTPLPSILYNNGTKICCNCGAPITAVAYTFVWKMLLSDVKDLAKGRKKVIRDSNNETYSFSEFLTDIITYCPIQQYGEV